MKSDDNVYDPLWNDNDLLGRLTIQRAYDGIQGEHGFLHGTLIRIARDCQFSALLAVDLHRNEDAAFHDEIIVEEGPGRHRDKLAVAERGRAFFGKMRRNRRDDRDQDL